MVQKQIDTMAEALRSKGLTWNQTNFAVSLVRNALSAERERCAKIVEEHNPGSSYHIRAALAAEIRRA